MYGQRADAVVCLAGPPLDVKLGEVLALLHVILIFELGQMIALILAACLCLFV